MNKQQLAAKIWKTANNMRSKIEANEYKDYILGFIFYKFLSDKLEDSLKNDGWDDESFKEGLDETDDEIVKYCKKKFGYFISYDNLFSTWLAKGKDFTVADVRDALSAFNRNIYESHKKVFDKIFFTLETGLSKLGDSSGSQTKAVNELIHLIKDIPMDDKQGYDVLGFIYEYLISMFAANAGKKAGEFYTPHEVSLVMSEIVANHLKQKDEISIYDPTSGSGSLLINIGKSVAKYMKDKNKIKYYAQELKDNTYNLTRMNLIMRGILPDNIVARNGDTLEDDWPYFDDNDKERTYQALYVDAVVSNPPYSQAWDPKNKENDARFSRFGLAPKSKADYAFLLHDLYHLKPDGIMTIVLPHGVLFRGGEEEKIRTNLIEQNHIDAIIGLPANIFFGTGIPTIVMVLKQKRTNTDVLIIDASKGFIKVGKNNKLQASDIKKIVDTVVNRESIEKYSRVVTRDEIRQNEYNLNIPRYVDSSEKAESWDIFATMFGGTPQTEIDEMNMFWNAFPSLRNDIFEHSDTPYVAAKNVNIKETVYNNKEVKTFIEKYNIGFADFREYLINELIKNMKLVSPSKKENDITNNIFKRIENNTLIDKYGAYQLLDDEWTTIATDIEIIQTEGFQSTKKVDPNMVIKKKDGKEQEIQEGWIGHIIPFELIQKTKLADQLSILNGIESRLNEITSTYEELLDSLSEEDKSGDYVNEDGTAFVAKEVAKYVKQLKGQKITDEESIEYKILKVSKLIEEEKELKKQFKTKTSELLTASKNAIEGLTDEEVMELLEMKWITPIVEDLKKMPTIMINDFIVKLNKLIKKYEYTYLDIASEISDAENELANLIDELQCNEFDAKGLAEFKKMLIGEEDE